MDMSGEVPGTSTRLERLESDLSAIKNQVANLESEISTVKAGHKSMQEDLATLNTKMDEQTLDLKKVVAFADGTDKVFGFCRAHWRTILKFGCGFVTAYGISNPSVQRTIIFVQHFFGL